jgi:hypothetical protein
MLIDKQLNLSKELDWFCGKDTTIEQELNKCENKQVHKHLKQISSIVWHIKSLYTPNERTCFVELGSIIYLIFWKNTKNTKIPRTFEKN